MTLRLVQAGRGERRTVIVIYYLTAELDRRVREAVGPDPIIVNDTRPQARTAEYRGVGAGGILPLAQAVERARELSGALATGDVVVVGFSAGCQAVRSLLLHAGGRRPDAVVTIDGTHAATPPADWQIDVWRKLAAEARRGELPWVATHTCIRPPTFESTRCVLELATGWELPDGAEGRRFEGGLAVWSYPGRDAAAHVEQARDVLPAAIAEALELLEAPMAPQAAPSGGGGQPEPAPSSDSPTGRDRGPSALGEAVVAAAVDSLAAGVAEVPPGSNSGPIVEAWLRAVGVSGPASWCAAGVTAWLRAAAEAIGVSCPVAGSAGARALGAQFRAAGRWAGGWQARAPWASPRCVPVLHLYPGQVVVWMRGEPAGWQGHVGILERFEGSALHTIEANSGPSGDRVARMVRSLDDPRLLGFGLVTTPEEAIAEPAVSYQPSEAELAEAARLMALGAEVMLGEPRDPLGRLA